MRNFLFGPLVAALAGFAGPAQAAPPAPPRSLSVMNRDASLIAAWVTQINKAIEPANAAVVATQSKLEAIWASSHDPASLRAAAAQTRELLQLQRSQIAGAQAALAAIPAAPPNGAHIPSIDVTRVLTDARALLAQLLAYNDALIKFSDAAEKGDAGAVRAAMPTIVRGGLLIVDGQASVFRNRQALFPPDHPTHQAVGVTVALYRAMSAAMRAGFRAVLDHQPDEASAEERGALAALADEIAANARVGRRNLIRFRSMMLEGPLGPGSGGDAASLAAKVRIIAAVVEKMFLVGDKLEAWARTEGQENEVVRAKLGQSEALRRLYAIERELVATQAEAAAGLAGSQ
jgi:hypothetical protein